MAVSDAARSVSSDGHSAARVLEPRAEDGPVEGGGDLVVLAVRRVGVLRDRARPLAREEGPGARVALARARSQPRPQQAADPPPDQALGHEAAGHEGLDRHGALPGVVFGGHGTNALVVRW